MGFKEVQSLDADLTIAIGGVNKKTGKKNPTSAEGYFIGTRKVESKKSKNGTASIHFLQTPTGNLGVWGKTDMDRKLAAVSPGTMIRVSFDKMVPTPNGDMYKYKVEVDDSNTIEVNTGSEEANYGSAATNDDDNAYSAASASADDEDEEVDEYESEEVKQTAALSAAERKAKVEALIKGKNRTARN